MEKKYAKKRKKKKGHPIRTFLLGILACILVFTFLVIADNGFRITFKNISEMLFQSAGGKTADDKYGWNLILINRKNLVPKDYDVTLTELSNGEKVDSRIYPKLQEMFDAARAQGVYPFVAAGYRTAEKQQELMEEKIQDYLNEGKSESEARELAEEWVAVPGTSEHQLGLAVDINADTTKCSSDAVFDWLAGNAYQYGFVKRYPYDKTEITGIINEPWHYRYVGEEAAREMYEKNLCLEEYIELLEEQ